LKSYALPLCLALLSSLSHAHSGGVDAQGGHFNRMTNTYHCHKEPCLSTHQQTSQAYDDASQDSYSNIYNRKDWPHWIDKDGDCQNTRHELLIATSKAPVKFKDDRKCTVITGKWYGVYTGRYFNKASDLDIDHIVPLSHAHRHGASSWTREQRKAFANDLDNLLVVDDSANQAKSDSGPNDWLPPNKSYWCSYRKKWQHIKTKYGLRYSDAERLTLSELATQCR